jgi:hypothetical protein
MNHLTESQLNEYLDNTLKTPEQQFVEKHLSGCADCRDKVEILRSLFQTLDEIPEEALHHDLTPLVLYRLPEQKIHPGWRLFLAVQTGIALGLTILVVRNLLPLVNLPNIFTAFTLQIAPIGLPTIHYRLPSLDFQTSTANLIFLAVSALILWGVGNAALLRGRREVQK